MALPSSGSISLLDIQTEFGGSAPIGINEYYAGGAYVPSGTTGTYGAVPSSGQISLSNFYGTSAAPPLSVTAGDVFGSASGFDYSGYVQTTTSTGTTPSGGTAPYTYQWSYISTSSGPTPSISYEFDQNPYWYATVDDGQPSISTWEVTVTDSGSSTATDTINVTLQWINLN